MELEHIKAHRTKKEKHEMSFFEQFVTEGNEKADELATNEVIMDGGDMAQIRASTGQQNREEVYAALQHAACFHCLPEKWHDCEELEPKPKEK